MVSTRQVLSVFMASPGDVGAERAELGIVVNKINDAVAHPLGWSLELSGWEQTIPNVGRPQSRINPDVEACDVFIGILWKRWGTPTGVATSGFREEFDIATARRRDGDEPDLLMYFRSVDAASAADPGAHLRQVLDFQRELTSSQEILYKTYDDTDEFARLAENHLTRILLDRVSRHEQSLPTDSPAAGGAEGFKQRFVESAGISLSSLMGAPYGGTAAVLARWSGAAGARESEIAPSALGPNGPWSLDPFDGSYGLTLIAGATGSGKSNAILSMALAVAFSLPPDLVRISVLDLEFQTVQILEEIGADSLPAGRGITSDAILEEARLRERRLAASGFRTARSAWRNAPQLRAQLPVWLICADEAWQLIHDDDELMTLVAIGNRLAGLGIHVMLGSQRIGDLGQMALASRARRIALRQFSDDEYRRFAGTDDPFETLVPGFAQIVEGNDVRPVRFAHADERRLSHDLAEAAAEWNR